MNLILAGVAWFFIILVSLLPFRILYLFSDAVRFFMHHVFGYRKPVIQNNLRRCFPEKSAKEIDTLTTAAYKNLTDVMVEGFKAFTMSRRQLVRRHKILNPDLLDQLAVATKSFIATPCHYGNWEWGALAPALQKKEFQFVAFYTALSNQYLDRLIRRNRARTGTFLASTRTTSRTFEELSSTPAVFIMAADQSPSKPDRAIWVDFFGQKTAFLNGPEKHAKQRNLPVVFADIQRVKRGTYTLELSLLEGNPQNSAPGAITQAYAHRLEQIIRHDPGNWLWSHKRWKLDRFKPKG
jgi:KDO2-lipid IV(A) lauroyltransferase